MSKRLDSDLPAEAGATVNEDADALLTRAREAYERAADAMRANHQAAKEDLRFARLGEQWDAGVQAMREREGRPALTFNKMPAFIRQVVNDARQNKPSIRVHPQDSGADPRTAEIINGLIRNIEVTSDADVAYDTAIEQAVGQGFGFWRINTRYAADDAFDQDIVIDRIANPFAVFPDPRSTAADSSDWDECFVVERVPLNILLGFTAREFIVGKAGQRGSLSGRILEENAANLHGLERVTGFLERALEKQPLAGVFASDLAVLRGEVARRRARFQEDWNKQVADAGRAYLDAATYAPAGAGLIARGVQAGIDIASGEADAKSLAMQTIPGNLGSAVRTHDRLADRQSLSPHDVRFSQENVSPRTKDGIPLRELADSMETKGWKGKPIDVVRMPDGALTSADYRRLFAARTANRDVEARVRAYDEPISSKDAKRFRDPESGRKPKTWSEAIEMRVLGQPNEFSKTNKLGSHNLPRVTEEKRRK